MSDLEHNEILHLGEIVYSITIRSFCTFKRNNRASARGRGGGVTQHHRGGGDILPLLAKKIKIYSPILVYFQLKIDNFEH